MCYDRIPSTPRKAIKIMGDLVRRGGKLNLEAVNRMKLMERDKKELIESLKGVMISFECHSAINKPEIEWDEYDQIVMQQCLKAKALIDRLSNE